MPYENNPTSYENNSIFWVEVDRISPNPYQPRKEFDDEKLKELADSINMYGILQPLTVTRREYMREDGGGMNVSYELIAGERRLRAAKLAGLDRVPVIIRVGEDSEREKLELAIIENLQREDLNPIDRARALKQLADEFKLSHTEVAKKVGRSRVYISNTLRLLQLPEEIIEALRDTRLSEGHGRTLLMLNDKPDEQRTLFKETLLKKLSVREVERISRKIAVDKVRKKDWGVDPELIELERQLTESFGTRVQISKKDYGGQLVIDYFSPEDIRKILDMFEAQQASAAGQQVAQQSTEEKQISDATPVRFGAEEVEPKATERAPTAPTEVTDEHDHHARAYNDAPDSDQEIDMTRPQTEETQDDSSHPLPEGKEAEQKKEADDEDDADLYSIKNFSL